MTEEEFWEEFQEILDELTDFYEGDQAILWMVSPQMLLEGRTPYHAIREGRGDEVWAMLDQLKSGAYL